MDSLDKLLDELKVEYNQSQRTKSQSPRNTTPSFTSPPPKSLSLVDNILAEVKADFAEQDTLAESQKQQAIEQEKIRQAEIKSQRLAALQGEAEAWLKKLDPFSSEGLWFERFAETYPSKLEAAMEYLQTNR
jgi:hypothetical protein